MTNPIASTFGVPCAVLPLIHLASIALCVQQARLAFSEGASGVFLINHDGDSRLVVECLEECALALIADGHENPFVGVNLLGHSPSDAFDFLHGWSAWNVRAVWCDAPADRAIKTAESTGVWSSLFFASVAFKYQEQPDDIAASALAEVAAGADVLTTSGDATGHACDPAKVRAIRDAVGDSYGVAVASGVDAKNAGGLIAAGADALLVATSIARDFHHIDGRKLRELVATVKNASVPSVEGA